MSEVHKPHRHHERPNHANGEDRDEVNAALQRHPGKPAQGSATRADDGTPVSTTEHPVRASSLDPAASGQAASTVAAPPTDDVEADESEVPGDSDAPPAAETSSSAPSSTSEPPSLTGTQSSPPPGDVAGSPPPAA